MAVLRGSTDTYSIIARALRFHASLPIQFGGAGMCSSCGLLDYRTPSVVLKGKTPFEMLYQRPPPIQHLRTFGCLCFVHEQKHGIDKFASRSKRSIFVGYPFGKKGWRVYDLEGKKISVSRDVVFMEDEFPFSSSMTVEEEDIKNTEPPAQMADPVEEPDLNQMLAPPVELIVEDNDHSVEIGVAGIESEAGAVTEPETECDIIFSNRVRWS